MSINVTNLIAGPATLYIDDVGATEPVNATDPITGGWVDIGGTNDGVNVTIAQAFESVSSDQTVDILASLPTERSVNVETSLMERTLTNVKLACNGGTLITGATTDTFEPISNTVDTPPTYKAALLKGTSAINGKTGLLILRRCLVTSDVTTSLHQGRRLDARHLVDRALRQRLHQAVEVPAAALTVLRHTTSPPARSERG
jgi:hypothetical protein